MSIISVYINVDIVFQRRNLNIKIVNCYQSRHNNFHIIVISTYQALTRDFPYLGPVGSPSICIHRTVWSYPTGMIFERC